MGIVWLELAGPYEFLASLIRPTFTAEGDQDNDQIYRMSSNLWNSQGGWHANRRFFISATYHSLPLAWPAVLPLPFAPVSPNLAHAAHIICVSRRSR